METGYEGFEYNGPKEFRPLSAWAYFGYSILFMIPVLGWVMLLYCALSGSNINRRSFARFYFISLLLFILNLLLIVSAMNRAMSIPEIRDKVETILLIIRVLIG